MSYQYHYILDPRVGQGVFMCEQDGNLVLDKAKHDADHLRRDGIPAVPTEPESENLPRSVGEEQPTTVRITEPAVDTVAPALDKVAAAPAVKRTPINPSRAGNSK